MLRACSFDGLVMKLSLSLESPIIAGAATLAFSMLKTDVRAVSRMKKILNVSFKRDFGPLLR